MLLVGRRDFMVFATLAFLGAFGADQGLLTYFADLSGPGLPYTKYELFWQLFFV